MIRFVWLLALVSGCGLGLGSAYVGQWRPRTKVDFTTCRADDSGRCVETKQVMATEPARSFVGVEITYPTLGVSHVSQDGATATRVRLDPSLEILKGRGAMALGVRSGVVLDFTPYSKSAGPQGVIVPIDVLGHLSLTERLGIYAGAGYVPYARSGGETSSLGARGIGGVQIGLGHDLEERYFILTFEADTTWVDLRSYHSTALTTNIGIFF